ncbi:hypothetical protein NPIL_109841, partial [Nephila pilipes]
PHNKRLKDILDNEKLKNHQRAQEFKRELQMISKQSSEKRNECDALLSESSSKISWLDDTHLSIQDNISENPSSTSYSDSEEEESMKLKSKKPKSKEVKAPDEQMKEKFVLMIEDTTQFKDDTDFLENENKIITDLVSNNFQTMSERFGHMIELCTSLYHIENQTSLVQEYIERLNKVRLRQEIDVEKDSAVIAEELDELKIM